MPPLEASNSADSYTDVRTVSTLVDGRPTPLCPNREVGRIKSLDSLRGLAALSVVLHHILIAVPSIWAAYEVVEAGRHMNEIGPWTRVLVFSPLHAVFSGTEAVMIFFVLSGFVLMRQFLGRKSEAYFPYLVRRIFRIYPACWGALLLSAILIHISGYRHVSELSAGFLISSSKPFRLVDWPVYLFLLGGIPRMDTVLWSLIHEMRISIAFPKIAQWITKQPLSLVMLLSGAAYLVMAMLQQIAPREAVTPTLNFACLFVCGALIAKNIEDIREWWAGRSFITRWALLALSVLLYSIRWDLAWIRAISPDSELVKGFARIGAVLALFLVIASPRLARWLETRFLIWLGRISYSLYLVHLVILSALVYAWYPRIPYLCIAILALPVSFVGAVLLNRFVEQPCIQLGRFISERLDKSFTRSRPLAAA